MRTWQKLAVVLLCGALSPVHADTNATWTGSVSSDLNTAGNWVQDYVPTGIATFDSTYPSVLLLPTATAQFDIDSLDFPNSASPFHFTLTGPGSINITGLGLTGTNTNAQFTATNATTIDNAQFAFTFVSFPSSSSLGAALLSLTSGAAGTINFNNAAQLLLGDSDEYPTVPVTASDYGSISVTNNGVLNGGNEAGQIFLKGSSFTAGNHYTVLAINSGGAAVIESISDTGQMVFDGGHVSANFTAGDYGSFTFTNESGATIGSMSRGNNAGQVVFDGVGASAGFTVGNYATLVLTNEASTISTVSSGNDVGQMVLDGDHGTASFVAGNYANITVNNEAGGILNGLGFDTGQIVVDGDSGTAAFTVGTNGSIALSNAGTIENGSDANDSGQIVVDGNSSVASLNIGDNSTLTVTNSGSISSVASGSFAAQLVFDGSSMGSTVSLNAGSNVAITVTNSNGATITNTGGNTPAQIYFSNAGIYGTPTLSAINGYPSFGSIQGIVFDGTSTADNTNIVLEKTSLVVNTTSSPFSIASLTGDSGSVVKLHKDLDINTYSGASTTFAGVISDASGSNNLFIDGSGTQVLSGSNTFAGSTTLNGGTLVLDGSVVNNVTVRAATLSGTGNIGGNLSVNLGGTVSPGMSGSNTLNVAGQVTLRAGSVTNIEINSAGENSKIAAVGNLTLGGTVNVTQEPGAYAASGQYTILTGSGITGAFNPVVTGGLPGFVFSLSYEGAVYLSYGLYQIPTSGLSGNARKVANYLNGYAPPATVGLFQGLTAQELTSALDSASPSRNAFGTYIVQQTAFSLSMFMSSHLDGLRSTGAETSAKALVADLLSDASDDVQQPEPSKKVAKRTARRKRAKPKFSAWASGFAEYAYQSAKSENPSFNYISEAALGGFDYRAGKRDVVGGALGYAHTHFNEAQSAGSGNINYYFGSLYGNVFFENFYLSPAIWGLFDQIQNTRRISFSGFSEKAKANIYAWQLVPHLELGYDVKFSWGDLIPFSALDWAITWQRGYSEKGAAPFNAKAKSESNSMARSETGLKFCEKWVFSWGAFLLREKASYVFQKPFGTGRVNTAFVGVPSSFTVTAVNQNLNLADVAIDFDFAIGQNDPVSVNLGYEGEFGSNYWSNQLMLTVKKDF